MGATVEEKTIEALASGEQDPFLEGARAALTRSKQTKEEIVSELRALYEQRATINRKIYWLQSSLSVADPEYRAFLEEMDAS